MKKMSSPMHPKKPPLKRGRESVEKTVELPEVALAAVVSYKKQKEVVDFVNFLLTSFERNSDWLNNVVEKQNEFRCALLVGAGPNRFTLQEIIYPSGGEDVRLEVEMKGDEDHDKIAIAALLKLSNAGLDHLNKYLKTRMIENEMLREDLLKGKALGLNFLILRPISDKLYRVMERIAIGNCLKCIPGPPAKKIRKDV